MGRRVAKVTRMKKGKKKKKKEIIIFGQPAYASIRYAGDNPRDHPNALQAAKLPSDADWVRIFCKINR